MMDPMSLFDENKKTLTVAHGNRLPQKHKQNEFIGAKKFPVFERQQE